MDTTFRSAPEPQTPDTIKGDEFVPNKLGQNYEVKEEPVENTQQATLSALGIGEDLAILPEDSKANVTELAQYIQDALNAKGILPTQSSFKRTLDTLKEQIGLDPDTMAEVTLDRLGGIVRAWKSLAFVEDSKERKNLFYKLARMSTSKEMNEAVFKAMEEKRVWQ